MSNSTMHAKSMYLNL